MCNSVLMCSPRIGPELSLIPSITKKEKRKDRKCGSVGLLNQHSERRELTPAGTSLTFTHMMRYVNMHVHMCACIHIYTDYMCVYVYIHVRTYYTFFKKKRTKAKLSLEHKLMLTNSATFQLILNYDSFCSFVDYWRGHNRDPMALRAL